MALLSPRIIDRKLMSDDETIRLAESMPLAAMHLALLTVFLVGVSPAAVIAMAVTYAVRVFALTGGYHRYFSHRSYRTSRVGQFVIGFLGASAGQLGPLWWASHHRHHHQHSDQPDDAHSPRCKGIFRAHMGWLMCAKYARADSALVKDFERYPEILWLDRFHAVAPITLAVALYAAGEALRRWAGVATTGWQFVVWGFVVSTVLVYHVTFCINSFTHVFGTARYITGDDSRNNLVLALLTMGEGWHNNHHHFPGSTRQGFYWWEIDVTYYILRTLQAVGLVWDIREPPARVYDEARDAARRSRP